jgi:flavorubredoxin
MGNHSQLKPVQIAPSVWHVGKKDFNNPFYSNPFLRVIPGQKSIPTMGVKGRRLSSLLVDPGSSAGFAIVQAKVMQLLGSLDRIKGVFLNHQSPDAGSSTSQIIGRYSPKAFCITSQEVWQLVQNSNIPNSNFIDTQNFHYPGGFTLANKRFHVIPTPFCHFSGAVMLYDPESRVLFSGALLAGLDYSDQTTLWAKEKDWDGIKYFHQTFMPNKIALQMAVAAIREIIPSVEVIAPQHGKILRGDIMHEFLNRIADLPVGVDLLSSKIAPISNSERNAWNTILNRAVNTLSSVTGEDEISKLMHYSELQGQIELQQGLLKINGSGKATLEKAVTYLATGIESFLAAPMIYEVISGSDELALPLPKLSVESFSPGIIMGKR